MRPIHTPAYTSHSPSMRLREFNKELEKQTSIYKRNKAAYDSQTIKDGPIARIALSRMANAEKIINELKGR